MGLTLREVTVEGGFRGAQFDAQALDLCHEHRVRRLVHLYVELQVVNDSTTPESLHSGPPARRGCGLPMGSRTVLQCYCTRTGCLRRICSAKLGSFYRCSIS